MELSRKLVPSSNELMKAVKKIKKITVEELPEVVVVKEVPVPIPVAQVRIQSLSNLTHYFGGQDKAIPPHSTMSITDLELKDKRIQRLIAKGIIRKL